MQFKVYSKEKKQRETEHKLKLDDGMGADGLVRVYCETHEQYIMRFESDRISFIANCCIYSEGNNEILIKDPKA